MRLCIYLKISFWKQELNKYKFEHGNQFASLYIENCIGLWLHPEKNQIQNRHILAGIIVFDFWLRNKDRDESNILLQPVGQSEYYIHMIDHGNCYPSKKALLELLADPSKLELSEVHKWCLSMVDDQNRTYLFSSKNNESAGPINMGFHPLNSRVTGTSLI